MSGRQNAAEYACAIIIKDGKTLLGRRAHFRAAYPNCWDFIGGKIEADETAEQALTRELSEEIAIAPIDATYFDKIVDVQTDATTPPIYHFFILREWSGGDPRMNNHEYSHLEWFTLQQAQDLSILALPIAYRKLLQAALN